MIDEDFTFRLKEDLFSVSKRRQQEHLMPVSHFHSTYEAYYLISGERLFFLKERTVLIKAGDFILLAPNVLHKTANSLQSEHEKIIINFKEGFLPSINQRFFDTLAPCFQNEYLVIRFPKNYRMLFEDYLLQIVKEAQNLQAGYEFFIQSLLAQMLIFASRHMELYQPDALEYLNPMHERISEIVRYINTNYRKNLALEYVADHFYISSYYLSRTFKEVTGFGYVEYVNSVRIKEAKKLLEETSLKVYSIAQRVGYGSVTHFGRIFKEITGHPPLYYRKKDRRK